LLECRIVVDCKMITGWLSVSHVTDLPVVSGLAFEF